MSGRPRNKGRSNAQQTHIQRINASKKRQINDVVQKEINDTSQAKHRSQVENFYSESSHEQQHETTDITHEVPQFKDSQIDDSKSSNQQRFVSHPKFIFERKDYLMTRCITAEQSSPTYQHQQTTQAKEVVLTLNRRFNNVFTDTASNDESTKINFNLLASGSASQSSCSDSTTNSGLSPTLPNGDSSSNNSVRSAIRRAKIDCGIVVSGIGNIEDPNDDSQVRSKFRHDLEYARKKLEDSQTQTRMKAVEARKNHDKNRDELRRSCVRVAKESRSQTYLSMAHILKHQITQNDLLRTENTRLKTEMKRMKDVHAHFKQTNKLLVIKLKETQSKLKEACVANNEWASQNKALIAKTHLEHNCSIKPASKTAAKRRKIGKLQAYTTDDNDIVRIRFGNDGSKGRVFVRAVESSVGFAKTESSSGKCQKRNSLEKYLEVTSGGCDEKDIAATLAFYLSNQPSVCATLKETDVFSSTIRLSNEQCLDLKNVLRLSNEKYSLLKRFLKSNDVDVLCSKAQIQGEANRRKMTSKFITKIVEINEGTKKEPKMVPRASSFVEELRLHVEELWKNHIVSASFKHRPETGKEIWIGILGDKGGTSTKIELMFVNHEYPNSIFNMRLLGMYLGTDSAANLRITLNQFALQFKDLKSIQLPYSIDNDGGAEMRPVRIHLVGDTKFICEIMGHHGPCSRHPCPWCIVSKDVLRRERGHTCREWLDDSEARVYGSIDDSVSQMSIPILDIDLENIVPPMVHIEMGAAKMSYKLLSLFGKLVDLKAIVGFNSIATSDIELQLDLQNHLNELAHLNDTADVLSSDRQRLSLIKEQVEATLKDSGTLEKQPDTKCTAAICLGELPMLDNDLRCWLRCIRCKKMSHAECNLVCTTEEKNHIIAGRKWICLNCQKNSKTLQNILQYLTIKSLLIDSQLANIIIRRDRKRDDIVHFEEILKNEGPTQKSLEKLLKDLGIDLKAYQTFTIVGNHCRKLFSQTNKTDAPALLTSLLKDLPEKRDKLYRLMSLFGHIFSFATARFLTDDEISQLANFIQQLGTLLITEFSFMNLTIKMHILLHHVLPFVSRFKMMGIVTEQGIECTHRFYNELYRQFCTIRDPLRCMELVIKRAHLILSIEDRDKFNPVPRKVIANEANT